jgi:hypothetical protein
MRVGGVASPKEDVACLLKVVVAPRRAVRTEGTLVGGHSRCHAEPGVGVHVGGSEQTLAELVGDVVVLGEELPREVQRD